MLNFVLAADARRPTQTLKAIRFRLPRNALAESLRDKPFRTETSPFLDHETDSPYHDVDSGFAHKGKFANTLSRKGDILSDFSNKRERDPN